jgi:hypothetical protein
MIIQYADVNKDGIVSSDEKDNFINFLRENGISYNAEGNKYFQIPKYLDGKKVPAKDMIKLLEQYNPNK